MAEALPVKPKDDPLAEAVRQWWKDLEHDPGGRAELRRCRTTMEVAFCPAFHRLRFALKAVGNFSSESLAAVAGILAHVREDRPGLPLAENMAQKKPGGDTCRVSGLRFRRLLKIEDRAELHAYLVRLLGLMDKKADVAELAETVIYWGPGRRKSLAYAYYDKAPEKTA